MNQNPGLMSGVNLATFGSSDVEIVNNLGSIWFIPFANVFQAGKSRLPYVFLKPCEIFRERFNLFEEVLCLFHPYAEIDTRVLGAIESVLSQYSTRLDRLCVVLVTNAGGLSQEVQKNKTTDSDPRIIIPFKYQELRGGVAGKERLMTERFEKYLFTKDLFSMSSALKTEKFFFGRAADVQKLIGHYKANENSSLFGLRRIGKTSVLWGVVRHQKEETQTPVVLIDGNDTKYHKAKWNKALYRVKEALFSTNGMAKSGFSEADYTEADASSCFAEDLKKIRAEKGKPSLIIFDEVQNLCFDLATSESWMDGGDSLPFWQTIRSVHQQNPNLYSFILAGTNSHILECAHLADGRDNPLFNYVQPNYLGFFADDDVSGMLFHIGGYMGISFESAVTTYLTDDFGGHPFLIRQAASKLWEMQASVNLPAKINTSRRFYQEKKDSLFEHTRNYIAMILEVLTERYPREYDLLRVLAAGDYEKFSLHSKGNPKDVEHLIGYGLIQEQNGRHYFRIAAVELAVKANSRDLICPESIEERWALISKERNQFEFRFRDYVRSSLKASLGKVAAKNLVISVMRKKSQEENAQNLEYDQIFHKEFYFSNLKDITLKNWSSFKFIFNEDKEKFSQCMDTANRLRADAHAKSITTEQFKKVMPQLVWLSDSFDQNS